MSSSALPPPLTSAQAREADRLTAEMGIPVEWLMEAAGWRCARFCDAPTAVACGRGNNGGDGLAAARHLHRWGLLSAVCCTARDSLTGAAAMEARALEGLGVEILPELETGGARVVLDAIFGTGLSRPPGGREARWIRAINSSGLRGVSVDVPSGLEADTGRAYDPTVRASETVTLGLPKPGLFDHDGPATAGRVWIADIGIPSEAYAAAGVQVPAALFAAADVLEVKGAAS